MTVTINNQFDCTQREFVVDIAQLIYGAMGYKTPGDIMYLYESKHPTEQMVLSVAEKIFELLTGDSPSYDDEDEEDGEGDRA